METLSLSLDHPVGPSALGVLAIAIGIGCVSAIWARPTIDANVWRSAIDALLGTLGAILASVVLPAFGIGPSSAAGSLVAGFAGAVAIILLARLVSLAKR